MRPTGDSKAHYISTAKRLFAAHGYHGVSLGKLAAEAGVTKQAILHFFGTKDRVYAAVLEDLAATLCAEVDRVSGSTALDRLATYLHGVRAAALLSDEEVRLVLRALLDADGRARHWPMKPYLDRLVALVRDTPGGAGMTDAAALAWVFQVIGTIQYIAVSAEALAGMYGPGTREEIDDGLSPFLDGALARLAGPEGG